MDNSSTITASSPAVPPANGNGTHTVRGVYDPDALLYPDSDGKPMADNTIQYRWIVTIQGNLDRLFKDDPNVFVAGDLLWYPVQGQPSTRQAPDIMVVFGRQKGDRGSYKQWEEGSIAPQVVFEVLSPGNRLGEMTRKFDFYDRYGVEEYYIYDPKDGDLSVWQRGKSENGDGENRLRVVEWENEWVSPLLGIRFVPNLNADMEIYYPDGRRFLTMSETDEARERAETERDAALARAERMAALLRAAGIDPETES